MSEDWKKGGQSVTTETVGFNVPKDFIKGTYTGKKFVKSKNQHLYELKGIVGVFHKMDDNKKLIEEPVKVVPGTYYNIWGKEVGKEGVIDDLFKKHSFGDIVGIQLEKETPSKTKGNHPFKVYETMAFGRDKDYMGEDAETAALRETFPDAEEV